MDRRQIANELSKFPGGSARPGPVSTCGARETLALPPQRRARSGSRRHWGLIFGLLAALTAMMAAITVFAFDSARQRKEAEIWYVHTLDVLLATSEFKTSVNAALRGERGYLLTQDDRFLDVYFEARGESRTRLSQLHKLTSDNPQQQQSLVVLEARVRDYFSLLEQTISLSRSGDQQAALRIVRAGIGRNRILSVLRAVGRMEAEERRKLAQRRTANDAANERIEEYGIALIGVGILFLAISFGALIAAARAQRRAFEATAQLRRMATTDELTGLPNRRFFLASLQTEAARARRSGTQLCLAIIDIDHFKRINDAHGHPGGDEMLRAVGRLLAEGTRLGDMIGRIGGEEFAVLMPDTAQSQAEMVCQRLRRSVGAQTIELLSGRTCNATLSIGLAELGEGETAESLVSRADAALYDAKLGGRDAVRLAA